MESTFEQTLSSKRRLTHWRDLYPFASNHLALANQFWQPKSPEVSAWEASDPDYIAAQAESMQRHPLRMHFVDHQSGSVNQSGATDGSWGAGDRRDSSGQECCLFVHGNPTWSFYWRNLILGLSAERRCVAVDHIGCGLSDKPQHYTYTLQQHIDNLCELIDHLDLHKITLIAHDWGGAIGLGAALARKNRIARIVLLNTGAFPPPYIPWQIQMCRIPWIGTLAIRGFNGFAQSALTMATNRRGGLEPAVQAGLIAPYHDWETRIATDTFVKDIPTSPAHPTYAVLQGIEQRLAELSDRPVQLIWGMQDWCFRPECLHRFQKHFPHARTHEIKNANHYVVEDAPEEVIATIQAFLHATSL